MCQHRATVPTHAQHTPDVPNAASQPISKPELDVPMLPLRLPMPPISCWLENPVKPEEGVPPYCPYQHEVCSIRDLAHIHTAWKGVVDPLTGCPL